MKPIIRKSIIYIFLFQSFVLFAVVYCPLVIAQKDAIKITFPSEGDVFSPGELIAVKIEAQPELILAIERVFVSFSDDILFADVEVVETSPFEIPIQIPESRLGSLTLRATAELEGGVVVGTNITINVQTQADLEELIINPSRINMSFLSEKRSLFVKGLFSDGREINLTTAESGTSYNTKSETNDIIELLPDGALLANGDGEETIIVANQGITKGIPVVVQFTNKQPVLDPLTNINIEANIVKEIILSATDPDGDIITFGGLDLPSFVQIFNSGNGKGILRLSPDFNNVGSSSNVRIIAIDDGSPILSDSQNITITVDGVGGGFCGDGILQPDLEEECDDGNIISGDGCSNSCKVEEETKVGDVDGDGDVDRDDLNILLTARNTPASGPDDPKDLDGDGMITALDARKMTLICTRPRCATE